MTHVIITMLEGFLTLACTVMSYLDAVHIIDDPINISILDMFLSFSYLSALISFYKILTNKEGTIILSENRNIKKTRVSDNITMYSDWRKKT